MFLLCNMTAIEAEKERLRKRQKQDGGWSATYKSASERWQLEVLLPRDCSKEYVNLGPHPAGHLGRVKLQASEKSHWDYTLV